MKKHLALVILAVFAIIPICADQTSQFGLSYTMSARNVATSLYDYSHVYSGIGLNFGGYTGGNFGFYGYDTIALPVSYVYKRDGKKISEDNDFSEYAIPIIMDAQFGLGGYVFQTRSMRLLLGGGLNLNMVGFFDSVRYYDYTYLTLGPGALADFSARIADKLFLDLQVRAGYNLLLAYSTGINADIFENVFSLTPVVGLTIQR
jgi:hypothetical protein